MAKKYKKLLLSELKDNFKKQGFLKKGTTWRRKFPELIQVFNVQGSHWGEIYYFNAGIYLRCFGEMESPSEVDCHIRERLPDPVSYPELADRVFLLADFEELNERVELRIAKLVNTITPLANDWFRRFCDLNQVKRELERTKRGEISLNALADAWTLLDECKRNRGQSESAD